MIAKALKDTPLTHTLRIVAFDEEEKGLIGSGAYIKTLTPSQIIADIQLEMMGTNARKDGRFHVIDCDKPSSLFLTGEIMSQVKALGIPITRVKTCTQRSDHSRFWNAGIPAVCVAENFFGGDEDPCYHSACDIVNDRMDFTYASKIATAVGNAAMALAL